MPVLAPELEDLNDRFFMTTLAGKTVIGMDKGVDGRPISPPVWLTKEAFKDMTAEMEVRTTKTHEDGSTTVSTRKANQMWLNSPYRRRFWEVSFDPSGNSPDHTYNLWTGFAVEPKKGDWSLFRKHIWEVVCRKDREVFDYVIGWMARAVQEPHLPGEVALVLRGGKGVGKGTFANTFGRLFGKHYIAVSNKVHLVGRFNEHLKSTCVLFIDEGFWAGDVQNESTLKQVITEPTIPVEAKFRDVENVPNRLHIIMASNAGWVVPVSGMERRFLVMDLDDKHAQDIPYFTRIHMQMEDGGLEAMLYDLLHYDLSNFNHRKPPHTQGLHDQMVHTLKGFDAWWYEKLQDGQLLSDGAEVWGQAPVDALYADYASYMKAEKRPALTRAQFGAHLTKVAPGVRKERIRLGKHKRSFVYRFPSLRQCRREWEKAHGGLGEDWNG